MVDPGCCADSEASGIDEKLECAIETLRFYTYLCAFEYFESVGHVDKG
jgi:hypothetical protein